MGDPFVYKLRAGGIYESGRRITPANLQRGLLLLSYANALFMEDVLLLL